MDNNRYNDTRMNRKKYTKNSDDSVTKSDCVKASNRGRGTMGKNVHKSKAAFVWGFAILTLGILLFSLHYFILPQTTGSKENATTPTTIPASCESAHLQLPGSTTESQDSYTVVWMSDTQYYAKSYPEIFSSMTSWIVDNQIASNIQYVIHTGDIVDDYSQPEQWQNARKSLDVLNGKIPYLTVAGNHDIGQSDHDYNAYLDFLDSQHFKNLSTFGGFYQDGQGRFDLLDINNASFILLSMGYGVNQDAINWMNEMLKQYTSRTAILCFHGYIDPDGSLTSDGESLYSQVVVPNANVKLILCGHRHGINRSAVEFDDNGDGLIDRTVYQLVANYQSEPNGGGGYLCILTFDTQKSEISVTGYSPYLKDYIYFDAIPELEVFTIPMDF